MASELPLRVCPRFCPGCGAALRDAGESVAAVALDGPSQPGELESDELWGWDCYCVTCGWSGNISPDERMPPDAADASPALVSRTNEALPDPALLAAKVEALEERLSNQRRELKALHRVSTRHRKRRAELFGENARLRAGAGACPANPVLEHENDGAEHCRWCGANLQNAHTLRCPKRPPDVDSDGPWIRAGCLDCDREHGPCEAHVHRSETPRVEGRASARRAYEAYRRAMHAAWPDEYPRDFEPWMKLDQQERTAWILAVLRANDSTNEKTTKEGT